MGEIQRFYAPVSATWTGKNGDLMFYADHVAAIEKLEAERDWLRKRDGHVTMKLCYNDGSNPFAREDLTVVDVGVSDNCYVVESKVLKALQAENKTLRALLKEAKCPIGFCDGQGSIAHQTGEGTWEQEQCQWCYECKQALEETNGGN